MKVAEAFGRAIKIKRAENDITQEELAYAAGMSRSHLSGIERGTVSVGLDVAYNLARALGCMPSDLWLIAEGLQA